MRSIHMHNQQQPLTSCEHQALVVIVDEESESCTHLVDRYKFLRDDHEASSSELGNPWQPMSDLRKSSNTAHYGQTSATPPASGGLDYAAPLHDRNVGLLQYGAPLVPFLSGLPPTAPGHDLAAHSTQAFSTPDPRFHHPVPPPSLQEEQEQHREHQHQEQREQQKRREAPYPAAYLQHSPRPSPEITSYSPEHGPPGTPVTVYFCSPYDLDVPPQVTAVMMFGQKRCHSVVHKAAVGHDPLYRYAITAEAPVIDLTNSPSPVPVHLVFDDTTISWSSNPLEVGTFTYFDPTSFYSPQSPSMAARKRKLSSQASPRQSPQKRNLFLESSQDARFGVQPPSYAPGSVETDSPTSSKRLSVVDPYSQLPRRHSSNDYHTAQIMDPMGSQTYHASQTAHTTPSLTTVTSPSWTYHASGPSTARSPSTTTISMASHSTNIVPSPVAANPPLIRTSTLQQSPTLHGRTESLDGFNPYAMYPANSKAILKIEGELNSMTDRWSSSEWESKRRLVQFRRSQLGSVITATFEAVTPETRIPNSICVSCIWWEEKQECFVTSVDTISLLESLVAVRFTVEEKNRIRRNLEGFRPATVSKVKADSEEFFKLIMGFPSPKPRNIEKDVKVFPWRILATALKKIIGKYSASYSSTAGALHSTANLVGAIESHSPVYLATETHRPSISRSETSQLPRLGASQPVSLGTTSMSATASHGHGLNAYTPTTLMTNNVYSSIYGGGSAGLYGPSAGSHPPQVADLRRGPPAPTASLLAYPYQPPPPPHQQQQQQHQPHLGRTHYSPVSMNSMSSMSARSSWDVASEYMHSTQAGPVPSLGDSSAGVPYLGYSYRLPPTAGPGPPTEQGPPSSSARFEPLHGNNIMTQQPTTRA